MRVKGGTRTHDSRNHNPLFYQLNYLHNINDWCVFTPNSPTAVSRTSQRATNLATTPCAELFFIVRTPPLSRWRLRAISSRTVAPYPSYLSPTPNCTCATSRRHPYFNGILIEDNRVFVLVTPWGYPYRTKFAGMVFLWRKSTMRIVVCSHYLLKLFRGWTLSIPPFSRLRRVRDLNPRAVFTTYLFSKQTPSPTWVTLQKKQNHTTQDELRFDSLVLRCGETTDCSALLLFNFHSHPIRSGKDFIRTLWFCYAVMTGLEPAVLLAFRVQWATFTSHSQDFCITAHDSGIKRGFANSPSHNSCVWYSVIPPLHHTGV